MEPQIHGLAFASKMQCSESNKVITKDGNILLKLHLNMVLVCYYSHFIIASHKQGQAAPYVWVFPNFVNSLPNFNLTFILSVFAIHFTVFSLLKVGNYSAPLLLSHKFDLLHFQDMKEEFEQTDTFDHSTFKTYSTGSCGWNVTLWQPHSCPSIILRRLLGPFIVYACCPTQK